jgi:uncharacterized protein YqeY
MSLMDRLTEDLAAAMRAKDAVRVGALRMLKAALVNKGLEQGQGPLSEAEAIKIVQGLVKQRRDSIEQFTRGQRPDLAEKEAAEIRVLEEYLPPPVDEAAIAAAVDRAIAETGATSAKDLGRVMKAVMGALAGQAVDGRVVNEIARKKLGA